jgi:hypothetical protein
MASSEMLYYCAVSLNLSPGSNTDEYGVYNLSHFVPVLFLYMYAILIYIQQRIILFELLKRLSYHTGHTVPIYIYDDDHPVSDSSINYKTIIRISL